MIRYIAPNGYSDGSTITKAAGLQDLDNQCVLAGPGGEVWILADLGDYYFPMLSAGSTSGNTAFVATLTTQVGTNGNPVRVRGKKRDGAAMHAVLRSNRMQIPTTYNALATKFEGEAMIGCNVSYVDFDFLKFVDIGQGAIVLQGGSSSVPAEFTNINIDNIVMDNFKRGLWTRNTTHSVNCTITNVQGVGYMKPAIRLEGGGANWRIENVFLDGDRQNPQADGNESFGEGIHVNGVSSTLHFDGVQIRNCVIKNNWQVLFRDPWSAGSTYANGDLRAYNGAVWRSLQASNLGHIPDEVSSAWWVLFSPTTYDTTAYWNDDGIATEIYDRNILIEDCYVSGMTDGGLDLKSDTTLVRRVICEGNKRNFRTHDGAITFVDCESYNPGKFLGTNWGGTGGSTHIETVDGGVRWIRGRIEGGNTVWLHEPVNTVGGVLVNNRNYLDRAHLVVSPTYTLISGTNNHDVYDLTVEYTSQQTALATADFLADQPAVVSGLRLLKGAYTGPLIKVRRVSDDAMLDVFPTTTGALDTAAITGFCGASIGTINTWYDQSGANRNAATTAAAREWQIYDGSAIRTKGANGKPSALITVTDSGYTANLPGLASSATFELVGTISNDATAHSRFMSLQIQGQLDYQSGGRAVGLYRGPVGSGAAWSTTRNSVGLGTPGGIAAFDRLDAVETIYDGTNRAIYVNGTSVVSGASTGAWQANLRLGLGYTGVAFEAVPSSYVSEFWFFDKAINSQDRNELYADQLAYFGVGS